jgi:hypothetical protein
MLRLHVGIVYGLAHYRTGALVILRFCELSDTEIVLLDKICALSDIGTNFVY